MHCNTFFSSTLENSYSPATAIGNDISASRPHETVQNHLQIKEIWEASGQKSPLPRSDLATWHFTNASHQNDEVDNQPDWWTDEERAYLASALFNDSTPSCSATQGGVTEQKAHAPYAHTLNSRLTNFTNQPNSLLSSQYSPSSNPAAQKTVQPERKIWRYTPAGVDPLKKLQDTHGNDRKKIAKHFPGLIHKQAASRTKSMRSHKWTPIADALLIAHQKILLNQWTVISNLMPEYSPEQCRSRWRYMRSCPLLFPSLSTSPLEKTGSPPVEESARKVT